MDAGQAAAQTGAKRKLADRGGSRDGGAAAQSPATEGEGNRAGRQTHDATEGAEPQGRRKNGKARMQTGAQPETTDGGEHGAAAPSGGATLGTERMEEERRAAAEGCPHQPTGIWSRLARPPEPVWGAERCVAPLRGIWERRRPDRIREEGSAADGESRTGEQGTASMDTSGDGAERGHGAVRSTPEDEDIDEATREYYENYVEDGEVDGLESGPGPLAKGNERRRQEILEAWKNGTQVVIAVDDGWRMATDGGAWTALTNKASEYLLASDMLYNELDELQLPYPYWVVRRWIASDAVKRQFRRMLQKAVAADDEQPTYPLDLLWAAVAALQDNGYVDQYVTRGEVSGRTVRFASEWRQMLMANRRLYEGGESMGGRSVGAPDGGNSDGSPRS